MVSLVFLLVTIGLASIAGPLIASAWSTQSLTTTLSPSSCSTSSGCTVGTTVTDAAMLSVTKETCTSSRPCNYGTVVFKVYSDPSFSSWGFYDGFSSCPSISGSPIAGFSGQTESSVAVPSTLAGGSASVTSGMFSTSGLSPGQYVWVVKYVSGGGPNSWPSYGPVCETMNLETSPSITTMLSSSSITVGGSVQDTASLSGLDSTASGTITFYYSTTDSCPSSGAIQVGSPSGKISGNGKYTSISETFNSPGTYYWYATYTSSSIWGSRDDHKLLLTSVCEPLTVSKASPSLSTILSSSSVVVQSGTVTDTATLSGATSSAGGTIAFYYTTSSTCSPIGLTPVATDAVSGSVSTYSSGPQTMPSAGSYNWFAVYSGDSNNKGAISACEPLTVLKTSPSVSTSLSSSVVSSTKTVSDSATLSGVTTNAGGSITFYYSTNIGSCTPSSAGVTTAYVATVLPSKLTYTTPPITLTKGTYYWFAYYSGDQNNNFAISPCGSETLTVTPQFPLGSLVAVLAPLAAIGAYIGARKRALKPF